MKKRERVCVCVCVYVCVYVCVCQEEEEGRTRSVFNASHSRRRRDSFDGKVLCRKWTEVQRRRTIKAAGERESERKERKRGGE